MTEPEGVLGYLLYLPETVLVLIALFVSWLGKPLVRGWIFYVVCLLIPLTIGVGVVPKQTVLASGDETEAGEHHQIRLVSANLDSWRADMERAARILAAQEPDLLCLQEVWSKKHLDAIRKELPDFQFVGTEFGGIKLFDQAVFVGVRKDNLVEPLAGWHGVAAAIVEIGEQKLLLVSVHGLKEPGYWPESVSTTIELQTRQAQVILDLLEDRDVPSLIGGEKARGRRDFHLLYQNSKRVERTLDLSVVMAALKTRLIDEAVRRADSAVVLSATLTATEDKKSVLTPRLVDQDEDTESSRSAYYVVSKEGTLTAFPGDAEAFVPDAIVFSDGAARALSSGELLVRLIGATVTAKRNPDLALAHLGSLVRKTCGYDGCVLESEPVGG